MPKCSRFLGDYCCIWQQCKTRGPISGTFCTFFYCKMRRVKVCSSLNSSLAGKNFSRPDQVCQWPTTGSQVNIPFELDQSHLSPIFMSDLYGASRTQFLWEHWQSCFLNGCCCICHQMCTVTAMQEHWTVTYLSEKGALMDNSILDCSDAVKNAYLADWCS